MTGSRIDLHIHTRYSGDNDADPEEIVALAIERGLDGIAFTEHYTYEASAHAERLRQRYGRDLLIIRGVELSAVEGHCLVFGADTDRLGIGRAPVRDVIRIVTETGGVVIPTHPYRGANSMGDLVLELDGICALEGCNGVNLSPMNDRAIEAARARSLPYTGGSDAHLPGEVGACFTVFEERVTEENFLALLKAGRYEGVDTRRIFRRGFPGF